MSVPRRLTASGTSRFLADLVRRAGGDPEALPTEQQRFAWLLAYVGLRLDPVKHWQAARGSPSGRPSMTGLRKLHRAISEEPYCFILSIADHAASAEYADVLGESYGYYDDVSGQRAFTEADRGSDVLYYRTSNSTLEPRPAFIARARVRRIDPVGNHAHRAWLTDYQLFDRPVLASEVPIAGRNQQHAIVEVTPATFASIIERAEGRRRTGGRPVSEGVREQPLPDVDAPFDESLAAIAVPGALPEPADPHGLKVPHLQPDDVDVMPPNGPRSPSGRRANKRAEERAVHVERRMMGIDGWTLAADRQRERVGYGLEFVKGGRALHVEVKGIRGSRLRFDLTAREWLRLLTDPDFVVIAVTTVLDATPRTHLLTRDRCRWRSGGSSSSD